MRDTSELLLRYAEEAEDDSYDSAVEDEFYNGKDPWDENPYHGRVFEKFCELPPELRLRIWELGLEEATRPRVLKFEVRAIPRKIPGVFTTNDFGDLIQRLFRDWRVRPGKDLARITEQTRAIMAVSQEAREMAHKILPHTLKVQNPETNGYGMIHCNRDRDVVHINGYERENIIPWAPDGSLEDSAYHFDGFAENVVQLSLNSDAFDSRGTDTDTDRYFNHAMEPFRNLKRIFLRSYASVPLASHEKLWCGSDFVYTHTTAIRDRGNDYFWTKECWPNADDYDDFVRNQIPTPRLEGVLMQGRPLIPTRGIMLLPMLAFDSQSSLKALDKLRLRWQESYNRGISIEELSESSSESGSDSDSRSELDEYESEGIDDSEIIENGSEENSDDDDMFGFGSYGDDDGDTLDENDVGEIVPVFSSPEPEPNDHAGPATEAQNSRRRRIVTDSDDDGPSEGPGAKRARTGRFFARVVTSDIEDEKASKPNGTGRGQRRATIVDSDDEDGDGTGTNRRIDKDESSSRRHKNGAANGVKNKKDREDYEEEGHEADEDDEEEGEAIDVRQLSLAARLELAPPRHPPSRKRKVGNETMSSDPEDSTETHDEDDDDERFEDELIDGTAEESDESNY